ncbi:MAG: hypothetical protein IT561_01990 [Alphaproteobacteria bacterium]|nr:hypothetical protein [Alphaproteobacteria bacterium]
MSWLAEATTLAGRFATAWSAAEPLVPVRWPSDAAPRPAAAAPWLRVAVVPGDARAVGLAADGRRLYRHHGLVAIDVFVPPGEGLARALTLADRAAAILRGWQAPGLACGAPRLAHGDDAEGWRRASLSVPFVRDTLF